MPKALRICACFALAFSAATPASADWHIAPFIGITIGGSTTYPDLENQNAGRRFAAGHRQLGLAVTRTIGGPIALEGLFAYVPGMFDHRESGAAFVLSSRTAAVMGNVVFTLPPNWNRYGLRPLVSGGFGVVQVAQTHIRGALTFRNNVLGYNIGGGATGALSERTAIRFDLRYISHVRPQANTGFSLDRGQLSYWSINVGYVIRLNR